MVNRMAIGFDLGVTVFPVERGKIHEFAAAIGDDDPVYHDEEAAAASPLRGIVAPLTFSTVTAFWEAKDIAFPDLGLDLLRVLHAEQEYEYLKPLRAGDTISARAFVKDVYEKEGKRGGMMGFVVFESEYSNQRGEVVARSRMTICQTSKAAG